MVSDSETYCCGFGARASCISRGLDYSGPTTPCEVRLVTDSDGQESCVGLEGTSGNLDEEIDCNCEGEGARSWCVVSLIRGGLSRCYRRKVSHLRPVCACAFPALPGCLTAFPVSLK